MAIGGSSFKVGIEAFTLPLVHDVFMEIEKPEHPIPVTTLAAAEPQYATIGEFGSELNGATTGLPGAVYFLIDIHVYASGKFGNIGIAHGGIESKP